MTIHLWFSSVLGYTLQFDIDHISFAQGYLKKFCINDLNHLQSLKIKHAAINVHYIHKTTRQSQLCVTKKRRKCSLPSVFIHYSYLYQWRLYIKCSISCTIRSCLSTEHLTEMDDPLSLKLSKYINFPWKNIQPAKNVQHAMITEKFISETLYLNAAKLSIRNTPKFTNIHFEIKIGSPTAQQVSYE